MRIRSVFLRVVFWVAIFVAVFSVAIAALFESGALTPSVVEAVDARVAERILGYIARSKENGTTSPPRTASGIEPTKAMGRAAVFNVRRRR